MDIQLHFHSASQKIESVFPKDEWGREASAPTPDLDVLLSSRCLDGRETRVKGSSVG